MWAPGLCLQGAKEWLQFILLEHDQRCLLQGLGKNDGGWGVGRVIPLSLCIGIDFEVAIADHTV